MKILVRATNWIGDAVMSLPALRAVRSAFPGAEIVVLAKPWVADLYEGETSIDRVILIDAAHRFRQAWALRRERFDLAILFPNSFDSALSAFLTRANKRIGYARDGRSLLLTSAVPLPAKGPHERFYYLELLKRAGLIEELPASPDIRLTRVRQAFPPVGISKTRQAETPVAPSSLLRTVGVSPGAAYGSAKRWLPERFAEAAKQLGGRVLIFGSAAEHELCEQVARLSGGENLAGKTTLREFIAMTAACDVFLTNDSGSMHIASALGIPTVTVFGPTDEFATGPTGTNSVIVREPVECAPCRLRECPIDHRCMTRVSSARVVNAALTAIEKASSRC